MHLKVHFLFKSRQVGIRLLMLVTSVLELLATNNAQQPFSLRIPKDEFPVNQLSRNYLLMLSELNLAEFN